VLAVQNDAIIALRHGELPGRRHRLGALQYHEPFAAAV